MSDKMSKHEWIERCAARMLAQQPALQSSDALHLAEQVWQEAGSSLDPEQAADDEGRFRQPALDAA